jgi:hypothetical protein
VSIRIMTAVWDETPARMTCGGRVNPVTATHKLILLALADWCNDEGICWPSVHKLAQRCSTSDRTVQRLMADFEAAGWIERKVSKDGTKTNVYRLHIDRMKTPDGVTDCHPYVDKVVDTDVDKPVDTSVHKNDDSSARVTPVSPPPGGVYIYVEPSLNQNPHARVRAREEDDVIKTCADPPLTSNAARQERDGGAGHRWEVSEHERPAVRSAKAMLRAMSDGATLSMAQQDYIVRAMKWTRDQLGAHIQAARQEISLREMA